MIFLTLESYAICGLGSVREENQDNLYVDGTIRKPAESTDTFHHSAVSEERGLYAVADGMGGGAHGGLASFLIVQEMIEKEYYFFESYNGTERFLLHANEIICDLMKKNKGNYIGSTFAGLCIDKGIAVVSNIGDSRIYLLREGNFVQLSLDHTAVHRMVKMGVISEEVARTHPDRNKLTQHLGVFPSEMIIEPHCEHMNINKDDIFLLCSDGLTDMVNDKEIQNILMSEDSLEQKANILFTESLNNGGRDNISILLVSVS